MIIDLGLIDYKASHKIQKDLVARRRLGEIGDSLVIAEHPSVFTIGRAGDAANLLADDAELAALGIEVLRVDRGGDITFHGRGQIVAYPIIDLKERERDLHLYMRALEGAVMDFLAAYSVRSHTVSGKTGVWVGSAKIAFIGIGASNWITYHGVSVNVDVDKYYFSMMNPCGMAGLSVTDMRDTLKEPVDMSRAKNILARELAARFGLSGATGAHEEPSAMAQEEPCHRR